MLLPSHKRHTAPVIGLLLRCRLFTPSWPNAGAKHTQAPTQVGITRCSDHIIFFKRLIVK